MNIVSEIYSSGGKVYSKNHSKEFTRNFRDILRKSFVSFITENHFPFGLIANQMTARCRKRHWDEGVNLGY